MRTMAAVEWQFRDSLTLAHEGLDARTLRDERTLEELTDQMGTCAAV